MSSAQESETGMGYINARDGIPLRQTLKEVNHPQGATPLWFDNLVATGILTDTVTQRRSKAMDMRFYWLKDRASQDQYHIHWKSGDKNLADYYTKHHPPAHHQNVQPTNVLNSLSIQPIAALRARQVALQGCVKTNHATNPHRSVLTRLNPTVDCKSTSSCKRKTFTGNAVRTTDLQQFKLNRDSAHKL